VGGFHPPMAAARPGYFVSSIKRWVNDPPYLARSLPPGAKRLPVLMFGVYLGPKGQDNIAQPNGLGRGTYPPIFSPCKGRITMDDYIALTGRDEVWWWRLDSQGAALGCRMLHLRCDEQLPRFSLRQRLGGSHRLRLWRMRWMARSSRMGSTGYRPSTSQPTRSLPPGYPTLG
jgi:hypothetical protein